MLVGPPPGGGAGGVTQNQKKLKCVYCRSAWEREGRNAAAKQFAAGEGTGNITVAKARGRGTVFMPTSTRIFRICAQTKRHPRDLVDFDFGRLAQLQYLPLPLMPPGQ